MKKRVGTRLYDTEKSDLIDTLPDGVKVYRKKNSPLFYYYDETAPNKNEMFRDLTPDEAEKYLEVSDDSTVRNSGATVLFSKADRDRIRRLATANGMSMSRFILMLVDEYENRR